MESVEKEWQIRGYDNLIEVSVRRDGITVSGHSGYAAHGSDIVCAGVSALFQTLLKSLLDLTNDRISYNISPGESNVLYGNLSEKAHTLVDSFFVGICMIADEYPDYVRVM